MGAWRSIPPHRPNRLSTYLGKITRRCALEKWKMNHAQKRGGGEVPLALEELSECIPGSDSPQRHMELKEFTIQAISKGSDDMGKVHMQVEYDGQMYYGFGANTDIIAASVEAYIDCINKFKR